MGTLEDDSGKLSLDSKSRLDGAALRGRSQGEEYGRGLRGEE